MDMKDVKKSFETLKQRVLKTEGQKAASAVNNIIVAINEALAEKKDLYKYNVAIGKVFSHIGKAEMLIKEEENLADIQNLIIQIKRLHK